MSELRQYRRRAGRLVTAVQLSLDFDRLEYQKWGGSQTAVPGDWLVENEGEVYTVARGTFERTYREVSPGRFRKVEPVWARVAEQDGSITTKEGRTDYSAGDVIVFNDPDEVDGYAMSAERFESLYEPVG